MLYRCIAKFTVRRPKPAVDVGSHIFELRFTSVLEATAQLNLTNKQTNKLEGVTQGSC